MAITLQQYINKLRDIDAPMQSVFYWFKEEIDRLLLTTYDAGQDPYKLQWNQRKAFYAWPILNKTGKQRDSFKTSVSGDTFTITNTAQYAKYHQYGTKFMDMRKILPEGELPEEWQEELEGYFQETLSFYLQDI